MEIAESEKHLELNEKGAAQSGRSIVLSSVRGRSLMGILVFSTFVGIWSIESFWTEVLDSEPIPLPDSLGGLSIYVLLAGLLWMTCLRKGVVKQFSFGARPTARQTGIYVLLGFPMACIAIFGFYIFYFPMSYYWPDFVVSWALQPLELVHLRADFDFVFASGINVRVRPQS